jgi:hypothetical protein
MWLMILIAVHISDPKDIPGKITLEFQDLNVCEQTLRSMTYWLKFDNFKVEGKCLKKYETKRQNYNSDSV